MPKNYKKVNLTSSNLSEEKLEELHHILPEAFSENKINWDKLRAVLGDAVDSRTEKFNFSWAGKSNAVKNVLLPSKATLSPAKGESVKFDESENLFIEGDNLEVLKLLQKAYFEKIKMIYIDPPYNKGADVVYRDEFSAPMKNYLQQTGQIDSNGNNLQTNRETNGRYHSDWLSMIYPRLKLAWNLLQKDGIIFVSIDDNEIAHLRLMLDEIFGEENFIENYIWESTFRPDNSSSIERENAQYVLCYARNKYCIDGFVGQGRKSEGLPSLTKNSMPVSTLSFPANTVKTNLKDGVYNPIKTDAGYELLDRIVVKNNLIIDAFRLAGRIIWSQDYLDAQLKDGTKIIIKGDSFVPYSQKKQESQLAPTTIIPSDEVGDVLAARAEMNQIFGTPIFNFPKPTSLIRYFINFRKPGNNDIFLDFFAGSGTTGQAVLSANQSDGGHRKFILVQLPEATDKNSEAYRAGYKTIADIAKERIRRVIKGYGDEPQPIDDGFKVFKLAESNYPENQFEFDPEKSDEENQKNFEKYLKEVKGKKQTKLFGEDKEVDVVYENIVKEGFSLNSKIGEQRIGKNKVYLVEDVERQLLICLDGKIDEKTAEELTSQNYKNKIFICLDDALNDTSKANLGLNMELKTI